MRNSACKAKCKRLHKAEYNHKLFIINNIAYIHEFSMRYANACRAIYVLLSAFLGQDA